jgi:hypothetical protein
MHCFAMSMIIFVKPKIETPNIAHIHYLHPLEQITIMMIKGITIPTSNGQIPHWKD